MLKDTLPSDPQAVKMLATRRLRELTSQNNSDDAPMAEGEEFVDALQCANESLSTNVRAQGTNSSDMADVYVEFIEEWCRLPTLDPHLVSLIPPTPLLHIDLATKLARLSYGFPQKNGSTAKCLTFAAGCVCSTSIASYRCT